MRRAAGDSARGTNCGTNCGANCGANRGANCGSNGVHPVNPITDAPRWAEDDAGKAIDESPLARGGRGAWAAGPGGAQPPASSTTNGLGGLGFSPTGKRRMTLRDMALAALTVSIVVREPEEVSVAWPVSLEEGG